MIHATVDGIAIDPGQLEMHYQENPFPGGSRYTLRILSPELAHVFALDFPQRTQRDVSRVETQKLFNLARSHISRHLGRHSPLFWANTVDHLTIFDNAVELSGVCSPHSVPNGI
jgi:hypothetical protein